MKTARRVIAVLAIAAAASAATPLVGAQAGLTPRAGMPKKQQACPYFWVFKTRYEFCIKLPFEIPI
jgi:hypothetical protein